ncbi:MAG: SprT family zinc-dependent metalloprotease [Oscillospiraceae bacterium]
MTISYEVNRSKRKQLYLCIIEGKLLVKAPKYASANEIEKAVLSKSEWIISKLSIASQKNTKAKAYITGESFQVLGESYKLQIVYDVIKRVHVMRNVDNLVAFVPLNFKENPNPDKIKLAIESFYKQMAIDEVNQSVNRMAERTGLKPTKVTIRKLNRSWGRCSSQGNISINQNIVMYSKEVIDYVVLHELCHLKHLNHSKDFWDLVSYYLPEYKSISQQLK